jgi:FkbM family methyltransferase
MESLSRVLLGRAQRALGRSRLATALAIKVKHQCDMVITARLSSGNVMSRSGEDWLVGLLAPSARNFVDVGANVGEWSQAFARRMTTPPKGLLFEPNPATAERLRQNLKQAGLEGLEVIEAAAGEKPGVARFFAEVAFGETSSLYSSSLRSDAEMVEIDVRKLDDELSTRGVDHVDFLKIDAEGHDFFALLGAEGHLARRAIGVVQFEYNAPWADAGATLTRAFGLLESHGYKVRLLRGESLFALDVRQVGEFFNYTNFVAYCPGPLGDILDALPCGSAL